MSRARSVLLGIALLSLATSRFAFAADTPGFPAVPPPSPDIPGALSPVFPDVPPPSPRLTAPASVGMAPAIAAPASAPAATKEQRAEEAKLKREQQAAKEREAKAQREFEAARKAGKAPASAYATPAVVEIPKTFAGKDAELQELLILYQAGQVSPEDYHKKRAQIIARP